MTRSTNSEIDQVLVKYIPYGVIQSSAKKNNLIEKKITTRCRICGRRITITWRKNNRRWEIVEKDPPLASYDEENYGWVCSGR